MTMLSRRTLLRGSGAALALPLLDAMRPAFGRPADPEPRRLLAVCTNLGVYGQSFFPEKAGRDFTLTPYLEPFEDCRDQFTIVSGTSHPEVTGGHSAEATFLTALRTGKLDLLEAIRWSAADDLKKTTPQLKWSRWLNMSGTFLAMRVDTKPFDDIRVRRALNYAVNKQEIVKAYYGGNAELFAYPQHPDYVGYFEPLDSMPASVKELFVYNPDKAKKLLAEAGYPKGFSFKVQVCSCSPDHMDLLPLVAAYLEQVGVKIEIQPMEYAAFLSAMTTKTNAPGYFMNNGHTNPTRSLHKSFYTKEVWNPSQWSDPAYDAKINAMYREPDEGKRQALIKELTREILDKAPYIWLPTPYVYTAWWPWVKGYNGELRAGAVRPGPIYARMWIDQDIKKAMGR